jgi:hypothetical protein
MSSGVEVPELEPISIARRNISAVAVLLAATLLSGCRFEKLATEIQEDELRQGPTNCFLKGTRILTQFGYVRIEYLSTDDYVISNKGELRRIKWIGRRGQKSAADDHTQAVCFRKGAFADCEPRNDLFVSGGHRLYRYGMLIAANQFLNSRSIVAAEIKAHELEYFHFAIEGGHGVIFAEGVPCETLQVKASTLYNFDNAPIAPEHGPLEAEGPCAEVFDCYDRGNRNLLLSHLRSALSPIIDIRTSQDQVRDVLTELRAKTLVRGKLSARETNRYLSDRKDFL